MIVVMPNGHTQMRPHQGIESPLRRDGRGQREAVASMEDSFEDIITFVESNYRVKKNKANRAVAGLSMGNALGSYLCTVSKHVRLRGSVFSASNCYDDGA